MRIRVPTHAFGNPLKGPAIVAGKLIGRPQRTRDRVFARMVGLHGKEGGDSLVVIPGENMANGGVLTLQPVALTLIGRRHRRVVPIRKRLQPMFRIGVPRIP